MKNILTIISIFIGLIANAQVMGYSDLGLLFSAENHQGTARTMAMKGAFGALGGDLSAIHVNPAGSAILSSTTASFTIGNSNKNIFSDFYGNKIESSQSNLYLSQAGGVLVYDRDRSNFSKIAVGVNYSIINDYNNSWTAKGIASPTWINDPVDTTIQYTNVESQEYKNFTKGKQTKLSFNIASQYKERLFVGASLNTYQIKFLEESTRQEIANDGNSNTVDAFESFWQEANGDGFSIDVGLIAKLTQNIRLGLSYSSPVWYDIEESSNMFKEDDDDLVGYYNLVYSNDPPAYENNIDKVLAYDYSLRTPSKLTGSLAFVFGKNGLVSADIIRKDYKAINLGPESEFNDENSDLKDLLSTSYQLNLGTEWRFKKVSLRAGYAYEQSPFAKALDTDHITGFALGLGYNFGNFNIDVAYDQKSHTDFYDFYPEFNDINGAELTKDTSKVLATLTFNL